MYGHTYSKSMNQPGEVANPARGQLNRGLRIRSRETDSALPRPSVSLLISILRLNLVLNYYEIPPEFRGGVHLFI